MTIECQRLFYRPTCPVLVASVVLTACCALNERLQAAQLVNIFQERCHGSEAV